MASLSAKRSRMQFEKISSNTPYQWKSDIPDSGCKPSSTSATFGHVPSEDVECRFQQLECSVHKMGMVLDSVQNDVIRLNRAMKDASLESNSLQKKAVLLEGSLQEIEAAFFLFVFALLISASKTARTSAKTGSRVWKRHSGRDRRPSVRFSGPDWYG